MNSVAVITARGGSKRIPRKNIRPFMGRPMISYAIAAALECNLFTEVMVSTDDPEIAETASRYGAKVPFMRSCETASDTATTAEVLLEVNKCYADQGVFFDALCCIYPCAPFLGPDILRDALNFWQASGGDALMPVCEFASAPQRALRKNSQGFLEYREDAYRLTRTQDLEPLYHDAGIFYFIKKAEFLKYECLTPPATVLYELPRKIVQDIDTLEDWEMAELKYRLINNA